MLFPPYYFCADFTLLQMLWYWFSLMKQIKWQYKNVQLTFPIDSSDIKIELSIKYDMFKWHNKYDFFQDKGKYSALDASCKRFWIHITKILVSPIHNHEWRRHCKLTKQYAVSSHKDANNCIIRGLKNNFLLGGKSWWVLCASVQTKGFCHHSGDLNGPKNNVF
jgi:hypothetical protein